MPTEKDIEELRAHRRRWDLPRASERHPDEAWALVRSETLDVALAKGQRWGGSWAIWAEDEYVPTMRAYFECDWKELGDLVWDRAYSACRARRSCEPSPHPQSKGAFREPELSSAEAATTSPSSPAALLDHAQVFPRRPKAPTAGVPVGAQRLENRSARDPRLSDS